MSHKDICAQVQERKQHCAWIEQLPFASLYFLHFDNQLGIECLGSAINQLGSCGGVVGVIKARTCACAVFDPHRVSGGNQRSDSVRRERDATLSIFYFLR